MLFPYHPYPQKVLSPHPQKCFVVHSLKHFFHATKILCQPVKNFGSAHTELLAIALAMPKKKWKLNIINGAIHTGLSKILSNSCACGKRHIFAKDFAKEWVGYAIFLASIAIAKESLFGITIAKLSVNGPLTPKTFAAPRNAWLLLPKSCSHIHPQKCFATPKNFGCTPINVSLLPKQILASPKRSCFHPAPNFFLPLLHHHK